MPLLDFFCDCCEHLEADLFVSADVVGVSCPVCYNEMKRCWTKAPAAHLFKQQWIDNIDKEPMHFDSKKQLQRELEKRDMRMPLAE